jgi:hypothetical protein
MNGRTLSTLVVLLSACEANDQPGTIEVSLIARTTAGTTFVPHKPVEGGFEVPFTLSGGVQNLRGPVRASVVLLDQPAQTKTLTVVGNDDGGFTVDFTLVAALEGSHVAQAEIGGEIHYSAPFVVPSGKASFGYVETIDGGLAGCVDVQGKVDSLELREGSADAGTALAFLDGTCSGPGSTRSARFTAYAPTLPLVVVDPAEVPAVAPVTFKGPASGPRLIIPDGIGSLPDAGEPFTFEFHVERDGAPLPWTAYSLSWAPARDGSTVNLTGTTDGNGEVKQLFVAPTVNRMEILIRSGSAVREFTLSR